jgi:hypothetical protein
LAYNIVLVSYSVFKLKKMAAMFWGIKRESCSEYSRISRRQERDLWLRNSQRT